MKGDTYTVKPHYKSSIVLPVSNKIPFIQNPSKSDFYIETVFLQLEEKLVCRNNSHIEFLLSGIPLLISYFRKKILFTFLIRLWLFKI
jgi:hypothetical protein